MLRPVNHSDTFCITRKQIINHTYLRVYKRLVTTYLQQAHIKNATVNSTFRMFKCIILRKRFNEQNYKIHNMKLQHC
jgi:hypothetical protein